MVVVVAEDAGAVLLMVVVASAGVVGWGGNLDHPEELVGELRDVLEPLGRPFGPSVFAVALYLAWGAVAQTVLELDVHVIYGILIRYGRA